ncbi:MAG: hypothetical protein WAV07_06775 [Candidatus Contendobacter sp.]
MDPSAAQHWERTTAGFTLRVAVGDVPSAGDIPLDGLLVVEAADRGSVVRRDYSV